jgi:hypothetical protein
VKLADLAAKWKSKGLLFAVPPPLQQQQCQHKTSRAQRAAFICTRGKVKIIKFYFLVLSAHDNPTKLLNASPKSFSLPRLDSHALIYLNTHLSLSQSAAESVDDVGLCCWAAPSTFIALVFHNAMQDSQPQSFRCRTPTVCP